MPQLDSHVMHTELASYFETLYRPFKQDIQRALFSTENEIYGELYYYSFLKLLNHLKLTPEDHFLDVGSGLGKPVFQTFLTTEAASVTGIEIHAARHLIASQIKEALTKQLPALFKGHRTLTLIQGDFLQHAFHHITVAYLCSTIFSFELLTAVGKHLNTMERLQTVASFRKLPELTNFKLAKKIFLHGSWDKTACYLYVRSF